MPPRNRRRWLFAFTIGVLVGATAFPALIIWAFNDDPAADYQR